MLKLFASIGSMDVVTQAVYTPEHAHTLRVVGARLSNGNSIGALRLLVGCMSERK